MGLKAHESDQPVGPDPRRAPGRGFFGDPYLLDEPLNKLFGQAS